MSLQVSSDIALICCYWRYFHSRHIFHISLFCQCIRYNNDLAVSAVQISPLKWGTRDQIFYDNSSMEISGSSASTTTMKKRPLRSNTTVSTTIGSLSLYPQTSANSHPSGLPWKDSSPSTRASKLVYLQFVPRSHHYLHGISLQYYDNGFQPLFEIQLTRWWSPEGQNHKSGHKIL